MRAASAGRRSSPSSRRPSSRRARSTACARVEPDSPRGINSHHRIPEMHGPRPTRAAIGCDVTPRALEAASDRPMTPGAMWIEYDMTQPTKLLRRRAAPVEVQEPSELPGEWESYVARFAYP